MFASVLDHLRWSWITESLRDYIKIYIYIYIYIYWKDLMDDYCGWIGPLIRLHITDVTCSHTLVIFKILLILSWLVIWYVPFLIKSADKVQ